MKIKLYTTTHDKKFINKSNSNKRFSSEEHTIISEKEYQKSILKNKENLINWSLNINLNRKRHSFFYLIDRINERNYNNILSLGSGFSDLEYFLYLALEKKRKIVSSEFDEFYIKKSNEFFPDFETIKFDLHKDNFENLRYRFFSRIFLCS